jgi:hypothetical protein
VLTILGDQSKITKFLGYITTCAQGDELMMEAVRTSETSVSSETTRRYIPEDSDLHTRRRENLKSHIVWGGGATVSQLGTVLGVRFCVK